MKRRSIGGVLLACLLGVTSCGDDVEAASEKLQGAESPLVRSASARRLGELGGAEAFRLLTTYGLRDTSGEVRAASIAALAGEEHPRLVDLFGELLFDVDPTVQRAAADALARRKSERARRLLEVSYARGATETREAIAEVLLRAGGSPTRAVEESATRRLARNLEALRGRSHAERIGAAEELGRSGRPEAVDALLPLLADRSVPLAAAAARGLGLAGDGRAAPALRRVLAEPYPELQRAAAEALRRLGDAESLEPLAEVAVDGAPGVAAEAARTVVALAGRDGEAGAAALCRIAGETTDAAVARTVAAALVDAAACPLSEPLANAARRGGPAVLAALAAVEILGARSVDDGGRRTLERLTADADPVLAARAWRTLAAVDPEAARDQVASGLRELHEADRRGREEWVRVGLPTQMGWGDRLDEGGGHEDEDVDPLALIGVTTGKRYRERFEDLLGKVARQRAEREAELAHLRGRGEVDVENATHKHLQALQSDPAGNRIELVPDVPPQAAARLADLARATGHAGPTPETLTALTELLGHDATAVRAAAVEALRAVPGPEATDALRAALEAPDQPDEVVAAAADALGAREGAGPLLASAARRVAPDSRGHLARALGAAGDASAVEALTALLEAPGSAAAAAAALAEVGGDTAAAALRTHLARPSGSGRAETIEALGRLGDRGTEAVAALRRALHDVRPEVRVVAAATLRGWGEGDPWLDALERDYDATVRTAAAARAKREEGP